MKKHVFNILIGTGLVIVAGLYTGILYYLYGDWLHQISDLIATIIIIGPLFVLIYFSHKLTHAGIKPYPILTKICSYIFPALVGFSFAQLLLRMWTFESFAQKINVHPIYVKDWVQLIFIFIGMLTVELYKKKGNKDDT